MHPIGKYSVVNLLRHKHTIDCLPESVFQLEGAAIIYVVGRVLSAVAVCVRDAKHTEVWINKGSDVNEDGVQSVACQLVSDLLIQRVSNGSEWRNYVVRIVLYVNISPNQNLRRDCVWIGKPKPVYVNVIPGTSGRRYTCGELMAPDRHNEPCESRILISQRHKIVNVDRHNRIQCGR